MEHNIALIGAGPRGTYCLRRMLLFLGKNPRKTRTTIHVIEKSGYFGGGAAHSVNLPPYLLLNTIGSQITAFGDDDSEARSAEERKTLWGYLKAKGIELDKNAYPSRAQHGQYLADMFQWSLDHQPKGVTVRCYPNEVVDITPGKGEGYALVLNDGHVIETDEVVLLTGHAVGKLALGSVFDQWNQFALAMQEKSKSTSYTHFSYPLPDKVSHIGPNESVYVLGLGLTAIDIVKSLTVGRGGRFEGSIYQASGKEPHIVLGSRLGLPPSARSKNQREEQYKARIFTSDTLRTIRQTKGKSDFRSDIFPLLLKEMEYVYYSTLLGKLFGEKLLACSSDNEWRTLIVQSIPPDRLFSWQSLENPFYLLESNRTAGEPLFDSLGSFHQFVGQHMEQDIAEAELGNLTSPIKTAIDSVLRDLRDALRMVVERSGLTAESHKFLVGPFSRTNNRIAVGPPLSAAKDLLILIKAGIVSFAGPKPKVEMDESKGVFVLSSAEVKDSAQTVQHVINGRIHAVDSKTDSSRLFENLLLKGWIRNYCNKDHTGKLELGGLDVTDDFQLIDKQGNVLDHISAIGIPLEGKYWFNAADARPDVNSTAIIQLDRLISAIFKRLLG